MPGRIWAWLRKPRLSWFDAACITLIWVTITVVHYFTGWSEDLLSLLVLAGAALIYVIAFIHGAWDEARHPHNGEA